MNNLNRIIHASLATLLCQFRSNMEASMGYFMAIRRLIFVLTLALTALTAQAADYQWFGPTDAGIGASSLLTSSSYTSNLGVAFTTGPSGPHQIQWGKIVFSSGSSPTSPTTVKLALRDTTNSTAYSAAAGSTEYAVDTLSIDVPVTTNTVFTVDLSPSNIPNIAAYAMSANTSYALILYESSSSSLALRRTTGYAENTTNDHYTVNDGFTALNTIRNNATFSNTTGSYVTFQLFFGPGQVTYNANDATSGTVPSTQAKYAGVDLTLATNSGTLERTGDTFAGWNTAPDGTGADYAVGATYSGAASLALYAKWGTSPPPTPVPTLSEWAMISFAMLIAGFGIYQQRRRQS